MLTSSQSFPISISLRFSSLAIHSRPGFARLSVCFHGACEWGCPLLFVLCFFSFSYFVDDFPSLLSPASALHFNVPSFLPRPLQLSMVFLVKCFLSLSALQRPQKYIVRSSRPSPLRHLLHTNCFSWYQWWCNTISSYSSWVVDTYLRSLHAYVHPVWSFSRSCRCILALMLSSVWLASQRACLFTASRPIFHGVLGKVLSLFQRIAAAAKVHCSVKSSISKATCFAYQLVAPCEMML